MPGAMWKKISRLLLEVCDRLHGALEGWRAKALLVGNDRLGPTTGNR
jgi:hypothetical protein